MERKHIDASRSVLNLESSQCFAADGKTSRKVILIALDENGAPVTDLTSLIHLKEAFITSGRFWWCGGDGNAGPVRSDSGGLRTTVNRPVLVPGIF